MDKKIKGLIRLQQLSNGLMKISKLILKLTGSINYKPSDELLKLSAESHGTLSNFNHFKTTKNFRSVIVDGDSCPYLKIISKP